MRFNKLNLAILTAILLTTIVTYYSITSKTTTQSIEQLSQQKLTTQPLKDLQCGFTEHFSTFLANNNYTDYHFERSDISCGAFGGKANNKDVITHIPIVFIHGVCDIGYGQGSIDGHQVWQTGFRALVQYLTTQGFQKSQMYITTWGPGNNTLILTVYHSKNYVQNIRAFIQAVLAYTGAPKINIVAHSMGVAIVRKAIKGGYGIDHLLGNYQLGPSLQNRIETFVGIAGINLGLMQCIPNIAFNYCNKVDGLFPGATSFGSPSTFLANLNSQGGSQGKYVYTVWSKYDELILNECVVWGKITCRINGQTGEIQKTTTDWGHFALRDRIGPDIIKWLL